VSDYKRFYENVRESEKLAQADLTNMSSKQALREFLDDTPTPRQKQVISSFQEQEDVQRFEESNRVQTERRSGIPEESVYRRSDFRDTIVRTSAGDIAIDNITSVWEHNNTLYFQTEDSQGTKGKIER